MGACLTHRHRGGRNLRRLLQNRVITQFLWAHNPMNIDRLGDQYSIRTSPFGMLQHDRM
jgi:hypothetical protein